MSMKHLTLFELHQFIQRVFYLNFEESVWVEAEISESRDHNGHIYMTLVEKNPAGQLLAKASCSLWRNKAAQLRRSLGPLFAQVVKVGNKVKMKCTVEFHPRYGYSLQVEDFDPAYTEGFLYLEKKKTIEKLRNAQLFDRNKNLVFPLVVKRIAVVSSATAAGYQDFIHQLTANAYGYHYDHELFPSAMQGDRVRDEFTLAFSSIERRSEEFDVIVVVRGGGSSVDLSDFDDYDVAAAVAQSSLPVLAGIGHERDISVTDMVSFACVKTPTAAAELLIENNLQYENEIKELYLSIRENIGRRINAANQELNYAAQSFQHRIKAGTEKERFQLEKHSYSIMQAVRHQLHEEQLSLQQLRIWVIENNPFHIMKRGYAMVFQDQQRIKDLREINITRPVRLLMDQQTITINEK